MRRMPQRCSSIYISEDLMVRQPSQEDGCRILPLPLERTSPFNTMESDFFKIGEEMSAGSTVPDNFDDSTSTTKPQHRLSRRLPFICASVAAAGILISLVVWRSHRHSPSTIPAVATQSVPVLAAALPTSPQVAAGAALLPANTVAPSSPVIVPASASKPILVAVTGPVPSPKPEKKLHSMGAPVAAASISSPSPPPAVAGATGVQETNTTIHACKRAFEGRRSKDVLALCSQAFTNDPQSAEVAVMLAKTEFDRGRVRQALEWSKKAIALDADRADAYVFLGGAEQAVGRMSAAKTAYKRYLELSPQGRYASDLRAVLASL
jgi:hypothetical protein